MTQEERIQLMHKELEDVREAYESGLITHYEYLMKLIHLIMGTAADLVTCTR